MELSLQDSDRTHLEKFASFLKTTKPDLVKSYKNYKHGKYDRCRVSIRSKHLWESLNSKGCVPNKSLILKFPSVEIFSSIDLIPHFIRGYIDGDGCLCFTSGKAELSVLGTKEFLEEMVRNLPLQREYPVFHYGNSEKNTYVFNLWCSTAVSIIYFLYNNSSIYLDRKFEKANEICRLYGEPYKELQTENGESCDANPVVTEETKESSAPYSVETEPEKSE